MPHENQERHYINLKKNINFSRKGFLHTLNDYGNLIIAIATVALVGVTAFHILEAKKMRNETKRLVDITIEQFKIGSYPTFNFEITNPVLHDKKTMKYFYAFENTSNVPALQVTELNLYAHKINNVWSFQSIVRSYYHGSDELSSFDFHKDMPSGAGKQVECSGEFNRSVFNTHNLNIFITIIKFKVPFEKKFQYKCFSYRLMGNIKEKNSKALWAIVSDDRTENYLRYYMDYLKDKDQDQYPYDKISKFLKDFQLN